MRKQNTIDIARCIDHIDMDSESGLRMLWNRMYSPLSWTLFKAICNRLGYIQGNTTGISDALLKGNLF